MKRVEEKVKDIVDVRAFPSLHDFTADPAQTLSSYHFTDITSDLMAKWLETAMNVRPDQGAAIALAGFRGVGKSHFLSVFGSILSQPELRDRISDQHVAVNAQRLSRRHSFLVWVRRGSSETLLAEIKSGIAALLGEKSDELSNSVNELLLRARQVAGEMPLIVLIDTSLGREERVSRDDGQLLSELAEAAKSLGIFVGLALDDDIAGADGANLSISGSYTIDFLDQEHLYKIVDSHIFSKKDRSLPLLHEIYKNFSDVLPAFRWSEQRFTSLYPMHPATLEIAPLIRLHLQDFALLGFAAEAGVRILGRPANSLIGLDEVFDAVESKLRHVPDLKDAFVAFDNLDQKVVGKTPVTLRLPAKLILKGLFMLSLDGQGSSAAEIAAAMLIYDDSESGNPGIDITGLLELFFAAIPDSITKIDLEAAEAKYCFKFNAEDALTNALNQAIMDVPMEAVASILLRQTSDKYSDVLASTESEGSTTSCSIEWRGAIRHGQIFWNLDQSNKKRSGRDSPDWTVSVSFDQAELPDNLSQTDIRWELAQLRPDEIDAIRRLHLLQTDRLIREQFKDKLNAASHIQSLAVEKIWRRVFLSDSSLNIGNAEYKISDEGRTAHTIAQLFTVMLTPVFEQRFPQHPDFFKHLGVKEMAKLTAQFFGGGGANNSDVQKLAEDFALPLGLVELQGEFYVPVPAESLAASSIVKAAFGGIEIDQDTVVKINDISSRMGDVPIGLTREAQHLVLAALVAQRQYEFVTFTGNRINHRSLDLQIIWDDIEGVAKPFAEVYTSERLRDWAILITGNRQIRSLERSEDRLVIVDTLSGWLANWKEARFLESFESLPDENLNSAIWRIAANLRKTFGALAQTIEGLIQNGDPLDQSLQSIADLFSDSAEEYEKKKNDLIVLRYYTQGAAKRDEISRYLALCDITDDPDIEMLRRTLLEKTGSSFYSADPSVNNEIEGLWQEFKSNYADLYINNHDEVMHSNAVEEKLKEILKSDRWTAFENLSDLAWFDSQFARAARSLIRNARQMECKADTKHLLESKPFCSCSFALGRFERRRDRSGRLDTIIEQGLNSFGSQVKQNANELSKAFDDLGNSQRSSTLQDLFAGQFEVRQFSDLASQDFQLLRSGVQRVFLSQRSEAKPAEPEGFADLLPIDVREWEDEIDSLEVFTNPVS